MNVFIYSRKEAEFLINTNCFPRNAAVISFYDTSVKHTDKGYTRVNYNGTCERIFFTELDDLDLDYLKNKGLTYETFFPEVDNLAEFIYKAYADGLDIICQCEYGQSRSAGCAAAILEHFYKTGISVFSDYKRYPNQVVYHKVFDALNCHLKNNQIMLETSNLYNPVAANKAKIYTVSMYAYNHRMWERCEPEFFFCEVYDQLELAVQAGKEELTRQIERLKEEFTANQDKSYDVFVRENVSYSFTVKEQYPQSMLCYFDDKTYNNWLKQLIGKTCHLQITPETDLYQLCSQQSECIEYEFDYTGALMRRIELRGLGYWRMPSDYEEDAGVKFVVGQVVHLKREPEKLYLVAANPGRLRDTKNVFTWENFYVLYPLEQSTHFPMDVPENEIEAYTEQEYSDIQQLQLQHLQEFFK